MEIKTILFWLLIIAMILPTLYFGYTKITNQKGKADLFERMGYANWFMRVVGLVEIAAAIGLLFLQTRMVAIAVLAIILLGAVFSHIKIKDKVGDTMTPVFVFVHLLAIFVLSIYLN